MAKETVERKHVRIRLRDGVKAKISIYNVFGSEVNSGEIPVLLHDMSPAGIKFATHLRFPVSNDYAVRMIITLGEWEFHLTGHIVWRRREENLFSYGCTFFPDRKMRSAISKALNEMLWKMSPNHVRIHELYQKLADAEAAVGVRMDARG